MNDRVQKTGVTSTVQPVDTSIDVSAIPKTAKRLLCLDGGGVKGVSSLAILKAIMDRVKEIEISKYGSTDRNERRPVDYFHLAGGTSTGGLAALMLFRLGLSTTETMQKYDEMAKQIFCPMIGPFNVHKLPGGYQLGHLVTFLSMIFKKSQYGAKPLEKAIDKVLGDCNIAGRGNAPLLERTVRSKGKMLMCATLADKGETILFRSYAAPEDAAPVTGFIVEKQITFDDVTMQQACRATSAAPTYLPDITIKGARFWDGGLLNNNPVTQVWDARYDLTQSPTETPIVSCVLSLGTSVSEQAPRTSKILSLLNIVSQTISFSTNTESKHRDFKRNMQRMNERVANKGERVNYFRFNAPTGTHVFGLADYRQMSALIDITHTYIKDSKVQADIEKIAGILANNKIEGE